MGVLETIASVGGSLFSGFLGYQGAEKGAEAVKDASEAAAKVARELFYVGREDLAPYTAIGQEAINRLTGRPAVYEATAEDLTALVNQRDQLQARITELETKGEAYDKGVRLARGGAAYEAGQPLFTTKTAYRPADPAEVAKLKSQLTDLNRQITETQAAAGKVKTPAEPGLLDKYPELAPFPTLAEYPETAAPPTARPYPEMTPAPTFDFGQGGVENALLSFTPEAYEQSPGYQWQLEQAQEAVERMAAARGYRLSPRALEEFMDQAQGLARTDYYNWLGSQLNKADFAIRAWKEGRQAEIEDWLMPHQMEVADWERLRGTTLEDWAGKRSAALSDWQTKAAAESADWTTQFNALLNLLGTGQSAAAGQATQAQNIGSQLAGLNLVSGQAESDKYIQQANALSQSMSSAINNALLYNVLNRPATTTTATPTNYNWMYANPTDYGYYINPPT